ncbi:MAG: GNAT family N-acetyltransferase [Hyphomicrobiaceae bacterium]
MDIRFRRFSDIADPAAIDAALDGIFFEASLTKQFESDEKRRAFRERWLGRYLRRQPMLAHLAFDVATGAGGKERLVGYVVGAHDDPAASDRYADIGYFPTLAHLTCRYPAHLHINLAAEARGAGVGSALIARFVEDARSGGALGVHVVTGAASRNVAFYMRNGFTDVTLFEWQGTPLRFLGRPLLA